jgi:phage terminase large subunit-like protein
MSTSFPSFCREIGLELESFQRRIVTAIQGAQRETVVLIPRGNGKTTLLAAIVLHHLLTVENAHAYCAAASRQQATVLFEAASTFARTLDHPNLVDRHLELRWCEDVSKPRMFTRHLRVLAADARLLHGLRPSLVIIDEMHSHIDDSVYVALRTAMLKIPNSKMICISSAGQGADTPLGKLRTRGFAQPSVVRKGAFTDAKGPNLGLLEWSLPEDADIENPRVVKKANPASWITPELLAETAEAVPEIAYRRFHCGQWTEREGAWLPVGAWQACVGTPTFTDGERVWVGVDVGGERSATAVVWINEQLHVGVEIFHGDEGVFQAKQLAEELAAKYRIVELIYDPWRFGQAAQELGQRGINVTQFAQSDSRMIPASDRLYRAVVEKRLVLPDHEELRQHAANAVARHSRRGWRLDAPSREANIDAVVALAMALEHAEQEPGDVELRGWI